MHGVHYLTGLSTTQQQAAGPAGGSPCVFACTHLHIYAEEYEVQDAIKTRKQCWFYDLPVAITMMS